MNKLFVFLIFFLSVHSCTQNKFTYPEQLVTVTQKKQFLKAVWLIYKFQYALPVYEVQLSVNSTPFSLKKIDAPFVACDIFLKNIEQHSDTITYHFGAVYQSKKIVHGMSEEDGIPNIAFIGTSDSVVKISGGFFTIDLPQDMEEKEGGVFINSFVYDTLGESKFIEHIKANRKLASPVLQFVCKEKSLSL